MSALARRKIEEKAVFFSPNCVEVDMEAVKDELSICFEAFSEKYHGLSTAVAV